MRYMCVNKTKIEGLYDNHIKINLVYNHKHNDTDTFRIISTRDIV